MMEEVVRLDKVIKMDADDRRALGGVSLCVRKGERLRILGAPGSGKTALARLIAGMDHPNSGTVFVLGEPVHEMNENAAAAFRNRHIGYVSRVSVFWDGLTVLDNITMPLAIQGVSAARREKAGKKQLDAMGLLYGADALPTRLSPYELRLAAIARALIVQPEILLLDEFLAGIATKEAGKLADLLHVLWIFGRYTMLTFTGDDQDAIQTDRKIYLDHGKNHEDEI